MLQGDYYPAISTYKNAKVRLNFGPKFRYSPRGYEFKPMSRRAEDMSVEQTMADMKYFTEYDGHLRLDSFPMES